MTTTAAFGIICKTPIPGNSKTRMIPALGADGAAELAGCLLRDISAAIEAVPAALGWRGYAIYAPEGSEAALRGYLPATFGLVCRRGATLGTVLAGAGEHLLAAGHDCAVLINADSPTLPPSLLVEAVERVRAPGARVVLGPAIDGGYYLIATKATYPALYQAIPWSTPGVLAATQAQARSIGLAIELLSAWYDVDDADSMEMLRGELMGRALPFDTRGRRGGPAAATRAFLDRATGRERAAATGGCTADHRR